MHDKTSIYWHRWTTIAALLLAWAVLAAWQWQEYEAECKTARDAMHRQAESLANALIGGVQSHRRFGHFVEEQLQAALDELAKSQDVLAVESGFDRQPVQADRRQGGLDRPVSQDRAGPGVD